MPGFLCLGASGSDKRDHYGMDDHETGERQLRDSNWQKILLFFKVLRQTERVREKDIDLEDTREREVI